MHLRLYVEKQDYTRYTPEDHAVWRFIMRLQARHLGEHAHPVYRQGLEKTGISIDHIPSIDEMNACLEKLGWRAVVVNGLIPSGAFVEFHCHRIMPIALDMRLPHHILYTPTPDIVHEAAGHAPFLIDIDYGEFLQKFGEFGMKAIATKEDEELFEAVRHLAILKELPSTTEDQVSQAEAEVKKKAERITEPSELTQLARLYWWTAEYGLVGTPDDYKIFGAGLLSSLSEARSCLDDQSVTKIPLTVDCVAQDYDVTKPQPQLFVTRNCKHMTQVLEEFADSMAFVKGRAYALQKAINAKTVCTAEYSSGLQVSGVFTKVLTNAVGREYYIGTTGPTQLAYQNKELVGHSTDYHAEGFGSPVGEVVNVPRTLHKMSIDELKNHGVIMGELVELDFLSGVVVKGVLKKIWREDHKNLIFTFEDCTVTAPDGSTLFEPSWGTYDMAVGRRVVSVSGGSADREKFNTYPGLSEHRIPDRQFSAQEKQLFALFQNIRDLRDKGGFAIKDLENLQKEIQSSFSSKWLLHLELLELYLQVDPKHASVPALKSTIQNLAHKEPEMGDYIKEALGMLV